MVPFIELKDKKNTHLGIDEETVNLVSSCWQALRCIRLVKIKNSVNKEKVLENNFMSNFAGMTPTLPASWFTGILSLVLHRYQLYSCLCY